MAEPTEQIEILFYDAVSDLAKTVEAAITDLRLSVHPRGFRFSDLKGIGKYKSDFALVEHVAEAYLAQTGADAYVFRASRNPNEVHRRSSAISENTSITESHLKEWKEYYSKKETADFWIKNMQKEMDKEVDFTVDMITRAEQMAERNDAVELRRNIARRVSNDFFAVVNGVWREVYDALNVKENPELLYRLAFNAETEKRWKNKKGDELAGALRRKGVSINEFEHYTKRDLVAEQAEKMWVAQLAPTPAVQTVQAQRPARTQTAPATVGINADDIESVIAAVDRGDRPAQPRRPEQPLIYTQPYILPNVRCVGSDGNVFEEYAELRVQADVARQQDNSHRRFTPYQAIVHFENQGEQFGPSMALSCNILLALFRAAVRKNEDGTYTTLDEHAKQILDQYKNYGSGYGWHAQNTIVDWKAKGILRRAQKSQIIHYPRKEDFPEYGGAQEINTQRPKITKEFDREGFEICTLEAACQKSNMLAYLQDFTGLQNPAELGEVVKYFGRTAKVCVSSENKTRAAWLGCDDIDDDLFLIADYCLSNSNAARGVASNNAP